MDDTAPSDGQGDLTEASFPVAPGTAAQPPAAADRTGWLPWCERPADPAATPHPGQLGPLPRGGDGPLVTADRGHLADCPDDLRAVARWLARHKDSPHTLAAYRTHIERFLLFLGRERGKALSAASPEDLNAFDDLLQAPQRWPHWYAEAPFERTDPRWRPLTRPLTGRSRYYAVAVVSRCYRWLVQVGYLRRNPVAASSAQTRAPQRSPVQERYLDAELWHALQATIAALPQATAAQRARYHRARWVFSALYATLARASELTAARMGDLYPVRRPGGTQWWWRVHGKHRRAQDDADEVPVPRALIDELAVYRRHLGLPAQPEPGEQTPLVVGLYPRRDGWRPLHRSTLHRLVKAVTHAAAERLEAEDPDGAERLRRASAHWLRHTGITHRLDAGWTLKDLQPVSRHADLRSLGVYAHAGRDRLAGLADTVALGWESIE